jgi:hypothetical protein
MEAMAADERCLVPGVMAEGVGLLLVLQDDAHLLHDLAGHMQVPGDPQDWRHADAAFVAKGDEAHRSAMQINPTCIN